MISSGLITLYLRKASVLLNYSRSFQIHMSHFTHTQDGQNIWQTHLVVPSPRDQVSLCVINGCCQCPHTTFRCCINMKRHWVILGNVVLSFSFFFGAAAHSCGRLTWAAPAGLRQNSKLLISELTWQVTKHSVNSEQHCWFSVAHLLALCCFFSGHFEMCGLQTLPHACRTEAALEDEDRHQLYLYLCCRHTPQWLSSTWRSAPGRGWLYWGRRSRGTGWHSTSPCCLTLDASTWSGCGALPEHCR